jgi:general secretion pathway protein E
VRQLCDRCKAPRPLRAEDISGDPRYTALGFQEGEPIHEPKGCERCGGTGYRGRIGIFEVLLLSEELRGLIGDRADSNAIDAAAVRAGMTTMVDDGVAKSRSGMTSAAEVLRVTAIR